MILQLHYQMINNIIKTKLTHANETQKCDNINTKPEAVYIEAKDA